MSDTSLRDALEKLCDRYDRIADEVSVRGGVKASYDIPGSEIRYVLAAHPAEPVGVSDEARVAGLKALLVDNGWHKSDGTGVWRANYKRAVDLVLEAAQPFLQPQVVRPVDRGALRAEIIRVIDRSLDTGALNPDDVVAAVLALMGGADNG